MLNLFLAEFKRNWLEFIRYPGEVIVGTVILVVLFYGFFIGASYMAGTDAGFGGRLDSIIVGYVVWTLTLHSLTSVANDLQKEAQVGALQQVFLSSYGPIRVFVSRTIADILLTSMITLTVLLAIMLLTGRYLDFTATSLLPLGAILLGSFGLSFLMGALALWLKRVQQITNLGQFVLLFLIIVPFENWGGFAWGMQFAFPIVPGVGLLRDLLVRGTELNWNVLWLAYANGLIFTVLGLLAFRATVIKVKRLGTLGWY